MADRAGARSDSLDLVLVFCDTEAGHWWNLFLKPVFRHVYACTIVQDDTGDRFWACLNGQKGLTDIEVQRFRPLPELILASEYRWLHIRCKRFRYRHRVPHLLQPFTCVEQVKALAGIRAPFVWTPRQLWRHCMHSPSITVLEKS